MTTALSEAREIACRAERIEAHAWTRIVEALTDRDRAALGAQIRVRDFGVSYSAPHADSPVLNRTLGLGLYRSLGEEMLQELCAHYASEGVPRWMLSWCPLGAPRTAPEWFAERGAQVVTPMVRFWGALPELATTALPETTLRVDYVDSSSAARFESVVGAAMKFPEEYRCLLSCAMGREDWRFYFARDGDEPVAGAAMFLESDGVWLGLAGTLEQHRRRGAQSALLAARLRDAQAAGANWATAEAYRDLDDQANPSVRNLKRAGFSVLYERTNYLMHSAACVAAM